MEAEGTKVAAYKVPKRTFKVPYPHNLAGREKGCAFTPVVKKTFNVNADVADRLIALYGWQPEEFTDLGDPKTDDTIIGGLDYSCIPLIREALTISKRLGQLAEGNKAWLKLVKKGKLHGKVHPSGTRTSRCTHTDPNAAQVPTVKAKYGVECRALFRPTRKGWRMVGTDASGIELRMLGHRMAHYDDGAMIEIVLHGDIHDEWQKATGLYYRDYQKNVSYSYLYGAGGKTVGMYVLKDWRKAKEEGLTDQEPPLPEFQESVGNDARQALQDRTPGLESFVRDCHTRHKRGYIVGIDGRVIRTKTDYGVVNDVLQSDAGITMKYAAVIRYNSFVDRGWVLGEDYEMLLNVHDEWQDGAPEEIAEEFGKLSVQAIVKAGEHLKLRIPLDGEYKIGSTWADTH
jgi:DNA polymerase I-like protein with 3'-5' exonuclease and polymerase domains